MTGDIAWSITWIFGTALTGFALHMWLLSRTIWCKEPYDRERGIGGDD